MLVILSIFLITLFFTVWLNAKFIKDASGRDQYWHTVQLYQMIWIYLSGWIILFYYCHCFPTDYSATLLGFALMYMLLYNSLLNILRKFKITYLGRYDRFSFNTTVYIAVIGLLWLIIYGIFL